MVDTPSKIVPVILSGGQGSRLWPLSRSSQPKQFIPFLNDQSLFEQTIHRTTKTDIFAAPIIICAQNHRFIVHQILTDLKINDALIICEPVGRNTAPAFYAAIKTAIALEHATATDCFAMLPADHYIPDTHQFKQDLQNAIPLSNDGKIVTFGIKPTKPHTGYGYIQKGNPLGAAGFEVAKFEEKPSLSLAQSYVESEKYLWNAGMFMFQGETLQSEMQRHAPAITKPVEKSVNDATLDLGAVMLSQESFEQAPDISFDYAVMEKTKKACVYPVSFNWHDLGAWDALWELSKDNSDKDQNVLKGDVTAIGCKNSYFHNEEEGHLLCAYGLQDIIAVSTPDATLIMPREQSQHVKTLINTLKKENREEIREGRKIYRPWGNYEVLQESPGYKVKRISVLPGQRLSLQKHNHRNEHWIVVTGTARVTRNNEIFELKANESAYITCGDVHRLENSTSHPLEMIEVQTGDYLGEDDIIRLEDDYNRDKTESRVETKLEAQQVKMENYNKAPKDKKATA